MMTDANRITKNEVSFRSSVRFIASFIVCVLLTYWLIAPIFLGLVQLSLDRFGNPPNEKMIAIARIALSLFAAIVAGLFSTRSSENPQGE